MTNTRLWFGSAIPRLRRPVIYDRVTIAADLEQWRYAAHRFRVAETEETAGHEVFEQILRRRPPRAFVKIDQHVAAENDVEPSVLPRPGRIDQVGPAEAHRVPQIGQDPPMLIIFLDKIF